MKVWVNKQTCIGCGACQLISSVFDCDTAGTSRVVGDGEISSEDEPEVMDAAQGCPTESIHVCE